MTETNFNIEEYINLLPDDIEILNVSDKNLTYIPDLSRFKKLNYLNCDNNQLTYLPNLPNSLVGLYCNNNKLTSLSNLPNSLENLNCSNNKLTYLPNLPNSLENLDCSNNKITYLPNLPNSLIILICNSNNQLTYLQELPNKLLYLNCNDTIIDEIIDVPKFCYLYGEKFNTIKNKLYIYNKFRELYFALKFKKQFYKLYETVVMKRYHPSNLIKLLENVGEDEEKMDILLKSW